MFNASWLRSFVSTAAAQSDVNERYAAAEEQATGEVVDHRQTSTSSDSDSAPSAAAQARALQSQTHSSQDAVSFAAIEEYVSTAIPEEPIESPDLHSIGDDACEVPLSRDSNDTGITDSSSDSASTEAVTRSIPFPDLQKETGRIAMSACLMGHEVRYNGGHCRAKTIMDGLSSVFEFVPVCPEVDIGLGTPRPTLRLVNDSGKRLTRDLDIEELSGFVSLYCPEQNEDYTQRMLSYAKAKVADLRNYGIDGFILKKDSPSCGLTRTKLYMDRSENSRAMKMYQGLFARTLVQEWPELPIAEEGMLTDEDFRNNFVQASTCHNRWRQLDGSFHSVRKFHETHKYILMLQDPAKVKVLGQLIAKGPKYFRQNNVFQQYYSKYFSAMKLLVSRGRHVNVLLHLAGHLRNTVDPVLYKELQEGIESFNRAEVPLVVPLTTMSMLTKSINPSTGDQKAKAILSQEKYLTGAPRKLKAGTAISKRTTTVLPTVYNLTGAANGEQE